MSVVENAYTGVQVRDLLRLSWHLRDAASPHQRWQSLLTAMCRATNAVSAYGMLLDEGMNHASEIELITMAGDNPKSVSGSQLDYLLAEAEELFGMVNPMARPFLTEFSRRYMESTAISRTEIVSDDQWYPSEYYIQYRRPAGLDDCMISVVPLPGHVPFLSAVCLNRASSDRSERESARFSSHDCRFAELIHSELRWACVPNSSNAITRNERVHRATPPVTPIEVAPRLRRVLVRLLAGDSEKQIAKSLSLSKHTIHEYIRALYRELGVSSRGELMARFVSGY